MSFSILLGLLGGLSLFLYGMQSEQFVEETFKGSLPAFLAAFNSRKKLSDQEIDEIQKLIDQMRG